ncbi:hypothetical protein NGRA_0783 [Nosema granulosis]|uniref:Uncharacterized protein n=1 Tax=Nosema granulosis TaxID=83296 RepID=A0A9P6KZ89_9MICR|nr:hypothetical protein NGRA_0783 [Nosema granulosis]
MFVCVFLAISLCLHEYEISIAVKLKEEIERRLENNEGEFIEFYKENMSFFKIVLNDDSTSVSEFNIEQDLVDVKLTIRENRVSDDVCVRLLEYVEKHLRTCNISIKIFDNRERAEPSLKEIQEKIKSMTCRPILFLEEYPLSEARENEFIFRFYVNRYAKYEKYAVVYQTSFPYESDFMINLFDDINYEHFIDKIKNYVEYSKKAKKKEPPFKKVHFPNRVLKEIKLPENRRSLTSTLTVKKFNEIISKPSEYDFVGMCVLLCQALEDVDFFETICSDSSRIFRSVVEQVLEREPIVRRSMQTGEMLLKIFKKNNSAFTKEFVVVFYIKCCDFVRKDLRKVVKKMSEDYSKKHIVNCVLTYEETIDLILKISRYLTLPPEDDEDYYEAFKAFVATYELNVKERKRFKSDLRLLNIQEMNRKVNEIEQKR